MNKTNDCLMIGSYVCGLNEKHSIFLLLDAEKHLHFDFVSVHVCFQFIYMNELARSLTDGNYFSSSSLYLEVSFGKRTAQSSSA